MAMLNNQMVNVMMHGMGCRPPPSSSVAMGPAQLGAASNKWRGWEKGISCWTWWQCWWWGGCYCLFAHSHTYILCVYIYNHIYIYILYTERERERERERESTHARKHRPNYVPADCMALAASRSTCSRDALSLSIYRSSRQPGGRLWSSTNLTFDEYMFEMNGKVYKP